MLDSLLNLHILIFNVYQILTETKLKGWTDNSNHNFIYLFYYSILHANI